ncbi:MAG: hypothetical protein SFT94_01610 [Pseudanabaenaceae cyanobacterium bins.68]|nr:hypothetical protein [Pseudanabaenaceae cyanobacterium bins.68]
MDRVLQLNAVVTPLGSKFQATCVQIDVAAVGDDPGQALDHLKAALQELISTTSPAEFEQKIDHHRFVARLEVQVN